MIDHRLLIAAALSAIAHVGLSEVLETLPPRKVATHERKVEIRLVEPPAREPPREPAPEPEPEPPPAPEPPPVVKPEPKVVRTKPTPRPTVPAVQGAVASDAPVPERAVVAPGATGTPVFGVTMESTSQAGSGPAMPVGNTANPSAGTAPARTVAPLAAPVAAYEVTKMPLPQGRCSGKYTDAARAAALEGTVVLDLTVDEKGRARDIQVVEGLGHGLTEAAVAALAACRFSPGEKDGTPVPVRVRAFKIRFVLQDP